jgi:hypothetical protein
MSSTPSPLSMAAEGRAPEVSVSRDIIKRGLWIAPLVMALGGIVLINFGFAAALIAWSAPISLALMMGVSLFGYLIRLGLIAVGVFLVRDLPWVSLPALGITIIVTHLGLLFWEMKFIAASLAFPGLRPNAQEWKPTGSPEKD